MTRPVLRLQHVLRQDLNGEIVDMQIWQKLKALFRPAYLYRSAATGEFVSAEYAKANPDTTYRQRILFPKGRS